MRQRTHRTQLAHAESSREAASSASPCLHQWSAWGHELRGYQHVQVRYCKCGAMQVKPDKK